MDHVKSMVITCSICKEEISREEVTLKTLGVPWKDLKETIQNHYITNHLDIYLLIDSRCDTIIRMRSLFGEPREPGT